MAFNAPARRTARSLVAPPTIANGGRFRACSFCTQDAESCSPLILYQYSLAGVIDTNPDRLRRISWVFSVVSSRASCCEIDGCDSPIRWLALVIDPATTTDLKFPSGER